MKNFFIIFVYILIITMANANTIVIEDHFDDGQLDPAWNIGYNNATGWTYQESGTNLTVTDIGASGSNRWNIVRLTREFTGIDDFSLQADISWDSNNNIKAMQYLLIEIYDIDANVLGQVGYNDGWVGARAARTASIGESSYSSGYDSMPYAGTAPITIERSNGLMAAYWDGNMLVSDTLTAKLGYVQLIFGYYSYSGAFFGTESIDYIGIESTTVIPEPYTILLLGLGIILLYRKNY